MANLSSRDPAPPKGADGIIGEALQKALAQTAGGGSVRRVYQDLVLPQLGGADRFGGAPAAPRGVTPADLDEFCTLLSSQDVTSALAYLDAAAARGVDFDGLLLGLLAGAARRLGQEWETDQRPFADVTVGMSRLQEALQHVSMNDPTRPVHAGGRGRALLAPCPGEQHNFAIMLLDCMFHRAGWDVCTLTEASRERLGDIAASSSFDIVGLSASTRDHVEELGETIQTVRMKSKNQNIRIVVGGVIFTDDPDLLDRVNADAAPTDPRAAVSWAEKVIVERQSRMTIEM